MQRIEINKNDHAYNRVLANSRVSLLNATMVRMGMMTSLSQFMIGATLGHSMTFWQAMLATVLGSLILEIVSLGMGLMGMQEGLSTSLLARWCGFGRIGSGIHRNIHRLKPDRLVWRAELGPDRRIIARIARHARFFYRCHSGWYDHYIISFVWIFCSQLDGKNIRSVIFL